MENRIFLNRYRLSLGRNGLPVEMHRVPDARTYRGHEIDTGREVAVTIVSPAPSDTLLLEKLETEAIAAKELNHINIPRLYDFGRENDELVYVSEYWEGNTASAWVEARGPLTVAAVLRVALQVTDAMNATVFQRVYHRALNPDNILFVAGQTAEGDWPPVKILHWHSPPPPLGEIMDARAENAARFMAPEQLREDNVDVRSEIYSLGATMWFLLTGTPPAGEPEGLGAAASSLRGVPKIVRHLLERMARSDPRERPQDPVALASYLQTCLARVERRSKVERRIGVPLTTAPRVVVPRTPMPGKRLAGALAVMLVFMLGILFLTQSLISRPSAQLAATTSQVAQTSPNESDLPDESTPRDEAGVAETESAGETDAARTSSAPETLAAASSGRRGELISISPVPAAPAPASSQAQAEATPAERLAMAESAQPASEPPPPAAGPRPRGELISISPVPAAPAPASNQAQAEATPAERLAMAESAQPASEPPPPAAGPTAQDGPQVADRSEAAPREESSPNEMASDVAVARSTTQRNEPHAATEVPNPAQVADSSAEPEAEAVPTATPHKTLASTRKKSLRESTKTRLAKDRSRGKRIVKRAQPLPKLRVGSAAAEYVGTTKGGDWILAVDATGETIVVPPPPGYAP